jgi:hypothetical protein
MYVNCVIESKRWILVVIIVGEEGPLKDWKKTLKFGDCPVESDFEFGHVKEPPSVKQSDHTIQVSVEHDRKSSVPLIVDVFHEDG